jgi:DNA-binding NarL/FixJ family response regulator
MAEKIRTDHLERAAYVYVRQSSPSSPRESTTAVRARRSGSALGVLAAVLLLAPSIGKSEAAAALQVGTRGIAVNSSTPDLLFKSIRSVAVGQYWIGRQAVGDLIEMIRQLGTAGDPSGQPRRYGLTPRELDIIAAVVAGDTNRVIAERLSRSEDTVKHHLTHISTSSACSRASSSRCLRSTSISCRQAPRRRGRLRRRLQPLKKWPLPGLEWVKTSGMYGRTRTAGRGPSFSASSGESVCRRIFWSFRV